MSVSRNALRGLQATAREADRRAALDRLLRDAPPAVDEGAYVEFLREMAGTNQREQ